MSCLRLYSPDDDRAANSINKAEKIGKRERKRREERRIQKGRGMGWQREVWRQGKREKKNGEKGRKR